MKTKLKIGLISFFSLLVIFASCKSKSSQSISNVKIVQTYYDQFYNESISALIYDGTPDEINELVEIIQKSKDISVLFVIKEALIDGEFSVKFYEGDVNLLNYRIFNSQNAYDEIHQKFKKVIAIDLIPNKIKNSYVNIPSGTEMLTREDFFQNCSEATIKSIFTNIKESDSFIYSEDYFPATEIDPDISRYLDEEYYGKEIRVLYSIKNQKNIILWLVEESGIWKCFTSLEYNDSVRF